VYVLGTARLRVYLFGWAVYDGSIALVSTRLLASMGVRAVPMGYALTTTVFGAVCPLWFIRESYGEDISSTMFKVLGCFAVVVLQSTLCAWGLARGLQFVIAGVMVSVMFRVFLSREHGLSIRQMLGLEPPVLVSSGTNSSSQRS
jgi:hypothetical protein